jgi:hypothetical protein
MKPAVPATQTRHHHQHHQPHSGSNQWHNRPGRHLCTGMSGSLHVRGDTGDVVEGREYGCHKLGLTQAHPCKCHCDMCGSSALQHRLAVSLHCGWFASKTHNSPQTPHCGPNLPEASMVPCRCPHSPRPPPYRSAHRRCRTPGPRAGRCMPCPVEGNAAHTGCSHRPCTQRRIGSTLMCCRHTRRGLHTAVVPHGSAYTSKRTFDTAATRVI